MTLRPTVNLISGTIEPPTTSPARQLGREVAHRYPPSPNSQANDLTCPYLVDTLASRYPFSVHP
jgi:hypothetical protein